METTLNVNDQATEKLGEITGILSGLDKKVVTPTVQVNGTAVVDFSAMGRNNAITAAANSLKNLFKADGGIVEAYADGGIDQNGQRVDRVSQIAQGGRNIVWGEKSTGWEAYISGKADQRTRNLSVLDEAARRLGRMVVPAGTTAYENGGLAGAGVPSFGGTSRNDADYLIRGIGDHVYALMSGTGRAVDQSARQYADRLVAGEAVVRR